MQKLSLITYEITRQLKKKNTSETDVFKSWYLIINEHALRPQSGLSPRDFTNGNKPPW